MKNNMIKTGLLAIALLLSVSLFYSCSKDEEKDVFVAGDVTELKKNIKDWYDSIVIATPDKFDPETVTAFKGKLDVINDVVAKGGVSQQEVLNLNVHLTQATMAFQRGRIKGIDENAIITEWDFENEAGGQLLGGGVKALVAKLKPGPSEIFTTTGLPELVEGVIGKGIKFKNGSHLEIDNYNPADFLGKQLSIAVWLKTDVLKGGNYVASLNYWENWKFQIQEQGKAFFTVHTAAGWTDADNELDQSVSIGNWKHVVVVLNLAEKKLYFYINGQLTKEWTTPAKPNLTGNQASAYSSPLGKQLPLIIGAATTYEQAKVAWNWPGWNTSTSWDHFQGSMDELKFYNIALEEGQVKWLYNKEVAAMTP